jgi:hypothetical protein
MTFKHTTNTTHPSSLPNRRQFLKAGVDLGLGLSIWSGLGFGLSACDSDRNQIDGLGINPSPPLDLPSTPQWWQQGNFAPVRELYADQLTVIGDLPSQLNGTYLRNGPNLSVGESAHFFDGDGMIHAITLADGQAQKYQASYVRTPRHGVVNPLLFSLHDYHCNVSILHHADQLLALGEIGYPFSLNSETLEIQGIYDY